MDKYKVIKKLGEGAYGVVLKCENTQTNEVVAVKKMKGKFTSWEECLNLREIKAMKKLNNHPNVVKIKEMSRKNDELNIVVEYCDKNLFQEMQSRASQNKPFSEPEIRCIMHQAISSIAYLHKTGFMHRDIKPENFLVIENNAGGGDASNWHLKLGDFGLAKELSEGGHLTDYVSTRWYRAPELLLRSTNYTQSVDVFALGCIMAELYMGRVLFPGNSEGDQLTKVCSVLGTPSFSDWPEGIRLAEQRGITFPNCPQLSLQQLLPACSNDALDLLKSMLSYDGNRRITAAQCLQHPYFKEVALFGNRFQSRGESGQQMRRIPQPVSSQQGYQFQNRNNEIYQKQPSLKKLNSREEYAPSTYLQKKESDVFSESNASGYQPSFGNSYNTNNQRMSKYGGFSIGLNPTNKNPINDSPNKDVARPASLFSTPQRTGDFQSKSKLAHLGSSIFNNSSQQISNAQIPSLSMGIQQETSHQSYYTQGRAGGDISNQSTSQIKPNMQPLNQRRLQQRQFNAPEQPYLFSGNQNKRADAAQPRNQATPFSLYGGGEQNDIQLSRQIGRSNNNQITMPLASQKPVFLQNDNSSFALPNGGGGSSLNSNLGPSFGGRHQF